ncbi:hypothetical protein J6590_079081 [Homalodisca vitripennis]|nr:hypothetical protein J6590_079081 [Homalodisca vitripennis]
MMLGVSDLETMRRAHLSFFVAFIWIPSDEHDSRFQELGLIQHQIPDASIKGKVNWSQIQHSNKSNHSYHSYVMRKTATFNTETDMYSMLGTTLSRAVLDDAVTRVGMFTDQVNPKEERISRNG